MSKRSLKSLSEKLEIFLLHLEEGESISCLARNHGISKETLLNWVRKYKEAGVEGLKESRRWTKYSKELKEQAVSDYLNGLGSLKELTEKYGIACHDILRSWIKSYTSGKKLKATSRGMSRMKQGCKTSLVNVEDKIFNRDFTATAPNQKRCTDVTFLMYCLSCKAYLSAIKNLYDGSIVAYVLMIRNWYFKHFVKPEKLILMRHH